MIGVCPRCDKALLILEFKGVALDFCERCHGLWLDAGELETLLARTGSRAHDDLLRFQHAKGKAAKGRRTLCPRCDRRLRELDVKGERDEAIKVDRCPRGHGLWFDRDELQQLLGWSVSGRGNKAVEF